MTSYTEITNAEIDADSPITQPLMTAMRDNPIAISEGATGAAIHHFDWHPYNAVEVGDAVNTGEVWSFGADGAVSTIETPTLTDGYDYGLWFSAFETSSTSAFVVQIYADTDAAWYTIESVTLTGNDGSGFLEIFGARMNARTWSSNWLHPLTDDNGVGSGAGPGIVTTASKQTIGKFRLTSGAMTFSAGAVRLYRRRSLLLP